MLPLPALLALLVQVPAPTQEAPEQDLPPSVFRAGRNLPAERTLIYVECAGFDVLVRNAKAITQVRALGDEECGAFLRYFALDDDVGQVFTWRPNRRDSRRALAARHADLANILSAFDLGFGAAFLFDDGERPRPRGLAFFAAGKRGGDQLAARDLLRKVLEGKDRPADGPTADPRQFGVELVDDVLAGSPVRMTMAVVKPKQDEQGMVFGGGVGRRPFLAYAFGPGAAAAYIDEPYDDQEKVRARAEFHLTQLMRLAHAETGVLLAPLEDLAEGEERLMAGALRWGPSVRLAGAVRDKDKAEMTQAGVGGFEGVQGELIATAGGVREVYRLLDNSGEGGLFTMFQPARSKLPEVAAFAPKDAIAFLNIGVDGGLFEAWCNGLSNLVPTRWFDPAGWMRALLGMKPGDGASLAGLTELTVMILPPSPGVPFPEPVLLFRLPAKDGECEALLKHYAKLFLDGMSLEAEPRLRTLGKGDRQVDYLSLKDLMEAAGQHGFNEEHILARSLGGGFFSVMRRGDHLIVGCNPRTVRRVHDQVGAAGSLLENEEFAAAFPRAGDQDRVLALWVNARSFFEKDYATQLVFGSFMTVIQRFQQGESSMPAMPKPSALGVLFDNESWSVHRKPYGLRFDHRGGTLSSPLVWTAMVYCNEFFDTLSRIIP